MIKGVYPLNTRLYVCTFAVHLFSCCILYGSVTFYLLAGVGSDVGSFPSLLCFMYGVGLYCFFISPLLASGPGPGNDGYVYDSSRFNDYDEVIPFSFFWLLTAALYTHILFLLAMSAYSRCFLDYLVV